MKSKNLKFALGLVLAAVLILPTLAYAAGKGLSYAGAAVTLTSAGNITIAPKAAKATTLSGQFVPYSTKTALTPAAAVTITSTTGNFFTLTPDQATTINATTVGPQGQTLFIKILTSGTSSFTLTFGTNFKSTGTLATGTSDAKTFVVQFLSDGTNYVEVRRTAAQ
jgi:hypothetical protein